MLIKLFKFPFFCLRKILVVLAERRFDIVRYDR
jgi:hypothetical protein